MTHKPVFSSILAVSALTLASSQAYLLENGTFDNPIPSLEDGTGWEAFGTPDVGSAISREDWANGAPGIGGLNGYAQQGDGNFGMVFRGFSGTAGGFYQDVPITAGESYDFHIQSHAAQQFYDEVTLFGGPVLISFRWYNGDPDSGGMLVSETINDITDSLVDGLTDVDSPIGPSRSDLWQDWDYTIVAPAGSAILRITVEWTFDGGTPLSGGDEPMRWDNAELTLTNGVAPANEMAATVAQPSLTFASQQGVTYTVEKSTDLVNFADAGIDPLVGTGGPLEQVFGMSGLEREFYRLAGTPNFADGQVRVYPASPPVGDIGWQGFMNVFELPENGGGYVFGSVWGVDDLVSNASTATTELILSPNTIGDPNVFWYQNTTGNGDGTNNGGPGQRGNKSMEANLYISFTGTALSGTTVTFSGTVSENTLTSAHTAQAFIKDFAPDFSSVNDVYVDLTTPGPFTVSLATDPAPGRPVQCGFVMLGENVWVTDVAPFGNVKIAVESFQFDETNLELGESPATVVSWTGVSGVHYVVQYSDDSGTTWTTLPGGEVVGTGGTLQASDPAGVVSGRTYQVILAEVPRVPAP